MTALDAMNGSQHWSTEPGDPHLDYTGFVSADNGKVGGPQDNNDRHHRDRVDV